MLSAIFTIEAAWIYLYLGPDFKLPVMKLKATFPHFDERLIEHLKSVGEIVLIPSGEFMLRPGQYVKSTILVLDGIVKLYLESEKGEEVFLYFLEAGSACALSMMCANSQNKDIKAKAVTDVELLTIPVEQMDALIKNHSKWYYFLLETYQVRFRELIQTMQQIAFHSMDQKLAGYLKQQFEALKVNSISITHQEIASDLNSSREVISRLLKKLESDHLIQVSRNEITNLAL